MSEKRGSKQSRRVAACGLLVASLSLGGCVVKSVSPIVEKSGREFDSGLVGSWRSEDDKETAVVTARDSDYLVVFRDDHGKAGRFLGRLGRLGTQRVLDLSPDDPGFGNDAYRDLLLPLHTFLIIDSIGARIQARAVKVDSLKAYLQRQPAAIGHAESPDNELVLTASTAEIRAFMEGFATRPGVLDPMVWTRR